MAENQDLQNRQSPLDMSADEFRKIGHELVDQIAELFESLPEMPVTPGDDPEMIWSRFETTSLPETGRDPAEAVRDAFSLLKDGSLYNGHPKFFGYITASAAPVGVLGDFLASAMNPNCGGWPLSPTASAIEIQTIDWIADLIGYPTPCGGILCSGGNVANILGFWAAKRWKTGADTRQTGTEGRKLVAYASAATHTWIQKASDLSGLGSNAVHMVPIDDEERMDADELLRMIERDKAEGFEPFMVAATGGTVSTGAIDPIVRIREICDEHELWMHVDGAYGAPAACLPEAHPDHKALSLADSVALDPHKWLYAPLEAGCVLVRDRELLYDAFSYRPPYYRFDEHESGDWLNFYELGIQNSRGFRALKVWLNLQQAGREGYIKSIRQDIDLAKAMAAEAKNAPDIEFLSQRLSIVVYRYVPEGIDTANAKEYLSELNTEILRRMQTEGEVFISNALINDDYLLRACIVNFRTTLEDAKAAVTVAQKLGKEVDRELRPNNLK